MLLHDVKLHYYKLESLTSCDLGSNFLTAVPDEVFKYTDLSWLDLRNNLLTELPPQLNALRDLRQLDARGNQIEHIPAETFERSALVTLSLANNRICMLGGHAPAHLRVRSTNLMVISDAEHDGTSGGKGDAYSEFQKVYRDSFAAAGDANNDAYEVIGGDDGGGNAGGGGWGWGELELGSLQNLLLPDNELEAIPQLAGSAVCFFSNFMYPQPN